MAVLVLGSGLGAICSPVLPPSQIYSIAMNAGFPPDVAVQMTAIALRESAGCPNAHNPGNPIGAEDSYGLWQINVLGNPGLTSSLGITKEDLFDPNVNAAAAYRLWAGNPRNLEIAWYINRPGYKERYEQFLPVVYAALGQPQQTVQPGQPQIIEAGLSPTAIVLGLSSFFALLLFLRD